MLKLSRYIQKNFSLVNEVLRLYGFILLAGVLLVLTLYTLSCYSKFLLSRLFSEIVTYIFS